jgi:phosphoenolpyruvate---glycerone phosphotransferase subunit DhaK
MFAESYAPTRFDIAESCWKIPNRETSGIGGVHDEAVARQGQVPAIGAARPNRVRARTTTVSFVRNSGLATSNVVPATVKKFINDPATLVADFLRGLAASHADIRVDEVNRVVYRRVPCRSGKVVLLSGGGSGHEPLHSGFVGTGMLDAACVGEVFTSPTPGQILAAMEAINSNAGVLLILKNYSGDLMNFEIAAQRAAEFGIDVRSVVIDDDVAGVNARGVGRRGVGLTVLAEKILGAAAETGMSLVALQALGERVRENGRSMGIGMTSCVHPGVGVPTFDIGSDEIEVGIGIHGEPGRRRGPIAPAAGLAGELVESVLSDIGRHDDGSFIAMVNGMGGTPLMELYVMAGEVERHLAERGQRVDRYLVGSYITSLEMVGCSLTLLRSSPELLAYWDAPVVTPTLRWGTVS